MNDPLGLFSSENDPLGLFEEGNKQSLSDLDLFKSGFAQVGNTADRFVSGLALAAADRFGQTNEAESIYKNLQDRIKSRNEWIQPDTTVGEAAKSALYTLPMQMLTYPMSPFETGQVATEQGETLPRALAATGIDTGGNLAGAFIGGKGTNPLKRIFQGAAGNAVQDAVTKKVIEEVVQTPEAKELFGPSVKSTAVSAIVGGAMGGATTPRKQKSKSNVNLPPPDDPAVTPKNPLGLDLQLELPFETDISKSPVAEAVRRNSPQGDLFEPVSDLTPTPEAVRPPIDTESQYSLFDQSEQGRVANPYEAATGDWRIDENGIPIKADLSMDAANMENPLQRNIWGDELDPTRPPVGQGLQGIETGEPQGGTPLTRAIDSMDWAHRRGAINRELKGEVPASGELKAATMEAEGEPRVTPERRIPKSQRGAIDLEAFRRQKEQEELKKLLPDVKEDFTPQIPGLDVIEHFDDSTIPKPNLQSVPKGQRGAIDFEGITEGLRRIFKGRPEQEVAESILKRTPMIPVDPDPETVTTKALAEGKDGKGLNYFESGATLTGMKRGSALIEGISRIVQNATKKAEYYIKETVFPVESNFRGLSMNEIEGLADIFKWEMNNRRKLTAEELQASGATMKQLETYAGLRQLFNDTMAIQNRAREKLGLEPVTELEYYLSSRWQGDFRQPVYDKTGKLVWYLAANTRKGLDSQGKALLKQFPDLVIDPTKSHVVKSSLRKTEMQSLYSTMLDVLGRDDPAVQRIKELVEQQTALEAEGTLAQTKHFEKKAGIRGYVGDRPGKSPGREAIEMFQQQMQYAKNAYKWAAMQEAGEKIKPILSNEDLLKQQPNNMKYAKEYWKNSLGYGESKLARVFDDTLRDLGVSPKVFDEGVGGLKSFFILQKLGMSAGYTMANIIQTANVLPHLAALHGQGYKGNPLVATTVGTTLGFHMATRHYAKAMLDMKANGIPTRFYEAAFRYAEDNGITTRSIYDEAPINATRGVVNQTARFLGKTMTIPETFVRSMAYMTYVQMLKDSKKFKNNVELFQKAEELTNASMVDYRANERPMAFSKMGSFGNLANTLQTFPVNFYNQWSYFGREAMRGNVAPILVAVALQYQLAGIMGLPYMQDLEKLVNWGKSLLPTSAWAKVKDFDPKLWLLENAGEETVYGNLSEETGVSMTSRVTAPSLGEMAQAPGAPIADLAKQGISVGKAILDPTQEKLSQAALDVIPTGLQGWLETGPLKDQTSIPRNDGTRLYKKASDLESRTGQYARTPEEEEIRKYGLRSQKEVFERDQNYKFATKETELRKRSIDLVDSYYSAIRTGNMEKAAKTQQLYTQLNGVEIRDEQLEKQILNEFTTAYERAGTTAKKLSALKGIARMKQLMENRDANQR